MFLELSILAIAVAIATAIIVCYFDKEDIIENEEEDNYFDDIDE